MALGEGRRLHRLADPARATTPWRPRRRRRRHGQRGHRAGPGDRARSGPAARGLGHRRQRRRARSGGGQRGGVASVGSAVSPFPASSSPRGAGSRRCRRGLRGAVDLLVANPPYVSAGEWAGAGGRGARGAAPGPRGRARQRRHARAGRRGGAAGAVPGLAGPAGQRGLELAPHQAEPAPRLARRLGYGEVRVEPDLAGRPRALVVRAGG